MVFLAFTSHYNLSILIRNRKKKRIQIFSIFIIMHMISFKMKLSIVYIFELMITQLTKLSLIVMICISMLQIQAGWMYIFLTFFTISISMGFFQTSSSSFLLHLPNFVSSFLRFYWKIAESLLIIYFVITYLIRSLVFFYFVQILFSCITRS